MFVRIGIVRCSIKRFIATDVLFVVREVIVVVPQPPFLQRVDQRRRFLLGVSAFDLAGLQAFTPISGPSDLVHLAVDVESHPQ